MKKTLLILGIVLVGVCRTTADVIPEPTDCSDVWNDHLTPCDHGRVCVWNKCHCRVGKPGCFLECSSDPRKKCNGLHKGDSCSKGHFAATCEKAGKLSCVPVPGQGKGVPPP